MATRGKTGIKVCRKCRIMVEKEICALCGGSDFTTTWSGFVIILDPAKSGIAKKMEVSVPGKFALRVR
ncbi:MAG: DNA-directed RNA polymerase, subunit E'' [Candidatus Altiarchaeota archaeon]|nr:DNA-directed RNA polymerase, subunit E'' [Candidatus Altiarchaeota archaeon]